MGIDGVSQRGPRLDVEADSINLLLALTSVGIV